METIKVEYYIEVVDDKKCIFLKSLDKKWFGPSGAYVFMEISESLLRTSYNSICFDLSSLDLISSSYFGVVANINTLSKELSKKVKYRFNSELMDIIRSTSFDKIMDIEEVK